MDYSAFLIIFVFVPENYRKLCTMSWSRPGQQFPGQIPGLEPGPVIPPGGPYPPEYPPQIGPQVPPGYPPVFPPPHIPGFPHPTRVPPGKIIEN